MEISSSYNPLAAMYGTQSLNATEEIGANRKDSRDKAVSSSTLSGDTVSFSSEAMQMLAQAQTKAAEEASQQQAKQNNGQDQPAGEENAAQGQGNAKGGGGGGDSAGGSQTESIQAQIKALTAQVANIMSGPMPMEQKQTVSAPYQQQIQQLEQQLQQLLAEEAKNA